MQAFAIVSRAPEGYAARELARQVPTTTVNVSYVLNLIRRYASGRRRSATLGEFAEFIAARTAFVSQKSTVEYCRARAGINWSQLFLEGEFVAAMERCRWEAYVAVLEDVAEVAMIFLRSGGADGLEIADGLAEVAAGVLLREPVPTHLAGWEDAVQALGTRLHRVAMAGPRPVHEVGRTSAKRVFKALPIHTNLTTQDREVVTNNIRFWLCRVYADMEEGFDGPALVRLLSEPAAGPGSPPGPR